MQRLVALIQHHHITIETQTFRRGERPVFPVRYVLHDEERMLQESMHTNETITAEDALHALFVIASAQNEAAFNRSARQAERQLKRLLGPHYDEFLEAFLADAQDERKSQWPDRYP